MGVGAIISESPVLFIKNTLLTTLAGVAETAGGFSGLGSLALQVVPVVQVPAADGETAVQALTIREKLTSNLSMSDGAPTSAQADSKIVRVSITQLFRETG